MSQRSDYNVNINIKTTDKTSGPSKKAAKGIGEVVKAASAMGAAMVAAKVGKFAVELGKLGATAQRQGRALEGLAQSAGTSGKAITSAIQEASDFTIDRMTAMQAANRAMLMDVAQTPEEFERLTKVAVSLGRAMGQDAAKSIDDFVTASARQSQMIADNLGLTVTVGKATERYAAQLGITVDELTDAQKKQAFLNMMLEEGEKKMAALGDTTLDAAGKAEQASAAWSDTKAALGEMVLAMGEASGLMDSIPTRARNVAEGFEAMAEHGYNFRAVIASWPAIFDKNRTMVDAFVDSLEKQAAEGTSVNELYTTSIRRFDEYGAAINEAEREQDSFIISTREMERSVALAAATTGSDSIGAFNDYQAALEMTIQDQDQAIISARNLQQAELEAANAAAEAATMRLGFSMQFTRQLDSMQESSAQFARDREQIEADHQAKITELQARGAARAVQINVTAEQQKLENLQFRMEQAQRKVAEMTGKEAESTRIGKEHALEIATAQYTEQQKLLDDYHAGRLVRSGENVAAMIDLENQKKDAAIAAIDEQMAKQQQLQEQQMGQMLLQTFDQWSQQKDIPVERMIEMRTAIAEEYGLVNEGATELVTDIVGEWDRWAQDTKIATDDIVGYMAGVVDEQGKIKSELLELTAQEWVIKVKYETSGLPPVAPGRAPAASTPSAGGRFQHGGSFMVGERGAEMITVQPLGQTITNNDTFNIYDGRAMAAVTENRRRQRRSGYARTM
jgi:hypothetical protein